MARELLLSLKSEQNKCGFREFFHILDYFHDHYPIYIFCVFLDLFLQFIFSYAMPTSSESREGTQAEPDLSKKPLVEDPGTGVQRRPRPPPHTHPRTREPRSTKNSGHLRRIRLGVQPSADRRMCLRKQSEAEKAPSKKIRKEECPAHAPGQESCFFATGVD